MSAAVVDLPVARAYQEELATRALDQNAILAMDTGTGKTLISVMVLRSKLTKARMNVAEDHRMVRISTPTFTAHTEICRLGCDIYRPPCPTRKPAGEFYSQHYPAGRWRIPRGQRRGSMESRPMGKGILVH